MSTSRADCLTRRQLLVGAGGAAGAAALAGGALGAAGLLGGRRRPERAIWSFAHRSATGPVREFRSRPDLLPPDVDTTGTGASAGYLFLGPGSTSGFENGPPAGGPQQGPLIVDGRGEMVWFTPLAGARWASNVRVQRYLGQQVVTWWEGAVISPGFGQGEGVIADSSYREIARVRAGNGRHADLHEFVLTPDGTALITCFPTRVSMDLSQVGGPSAGAALDSIFQEVDVRSGRVLLEWHSLDHVPVTESYEPAYTPFLDPYDYAHINTIQPLPDGHLLLSLRATWALYKLDRRTGEVIWRLGGRRSDFAVDPAARFAWQHHALQIADGAITMFDDGEGPIRTEKQSRAIVLAADTRRRTVRLNRSYLHPGQPLAGSMGSVQMLSGGHVLVGWGPAGFITEYRGEGALLTDTRLPSSLFTYRAYRYPWKAVPHQAPALVAHRHQATNRPILYASWNGATSVTHWRVHTGPTASDLRELGIAKRLGFETVIPLGVRDAYAAIEAVDSRGRSLARSPVVRI